MDWGPLRMQEGKKSTKTYCHLSTDKKGKYIFVPIKAEKGTYYNEWIKTVKKYGFEFDSTLLNSANFGAFTSRERYFAQFAKNEAMISWPKQTHFKKATGKMKKWKPVKEVLDLADEGLSIFTRKKPLVDNTLRRIYAGLVKFVANGDTQYIKKYFSGRPEGKVISIDGPAGTIKTKDGQALVSCVYMSSYYGRTTLNDGESPCGTLTTKDRFAKIEVQFGLNYYSGGGQLSSLDQPSPTITNNPKQRITTVKFVDNQYGQSKPSSIEEPNGSLTPTPKQNVVSVRTFMINKNSSTSPSKNLDEPAPTITQRTHLLVKPTWLMDTNFNNTGTGLDEPAPTILACRKHHYLMNPQYDNKGNSIEAPCFTLIARMDKAPPHIISVERNNKQSVEIAGFLNDIDMQHMIDEAEDVFGPRLEKSIRVQIIEFMIYHQIVDIKMRMLHIPEMLKIQGFPDWYKLIGTQTEQKKYIGNSVEVTVGKHIFRAIDKKINRKNDTPRIRNTRKIQETQQ